MSHAPLLFEDPLGLKSESTRMTRDSICQVLSRRYEQDRIYTSIGPVLVAVNPYKTVTVGGASIYDDTVARLYYELSPLEVAPHVYKVGSEAYKHLQGSNQSQCVIICGEVRNDHD
jgi:myosin-1